MKKLSILALMVVLVMGSTIFLIGCKGDKLIEEKVVFDVEQIKRASWKDSHQMAGITPDFTTKTSAMKLNFFGWGVDKDSVFNLSFPEDTKQYSTAILSYKIGAWNEGCSAWDNTTMIFFRNKQDGQWYELVRAITPYGNSFHAGWSKTFYINISEYLPYLTGDTEFRLHYSGFDATDKRAHTVTLNFDFFEENVGLEETPQPVFLTKIYESETTSNTGYRSWAYGVEADGYSIENDSLLGNRTIEIPDNVKRLEMKMRITGHGHDAGIWVATGRRANNAAEFDRNEYHIFIDGAKKAVGSIFYSNANNYPQAGTYKYDRANWAPGNPTVMQFWNITNIPEGTDRKMVINLDLNEFKSAKDQVRADGVAQYIVQTYIFGYEE